MPAVRQPVMDERERRLSLALRASRFHVWTLDLDSRRFSVAEALCASLNLNAEQCTRPSAWRRRIHQDDRDRVVRAFRECLDSGEDLDVEFRVTLDAGLTRWLWVRATVTSRDEGAGSQLYGVCADVTERRADEERLRQSEQRLRVSQHEREHLLEAERAARERAEAAARSREQFLAIVSHELRSPLNGIQNWSSVLDRQLANDSPPLVRRALAGIRNGVEQQVRLINDLLDATRIMSGSLSLSTSVIELRPVVEAAIASVSGAAASKGVALGTHLHLGNERVRADPDRIQQIVWNLLSNALKFTARDGHIDVALDTFDGGVRLVVTDDGKGIAADFLPRMFDWFHRDETSTHRGEDGLGLGLALVRHLCILHGGRVQAYSDGPGRGSRLEVWLPMLEAPDVSGGSTVQPTQAAHTLPSLAAIRILLIDDQPDALDALSALLSTMGAQVQAFASSAELLAWLSAQDLQGCADVAICDIAMPGEDGYSALARVRALERRNGLTPSSILPVIALTAFAQREDRQRALDAGFAVHLTKPVQPEELVHAIRALVPAAGRASRA